MPKLVVKNLQNEQVGEIVLSDSVFASPVKEHLLHEIVRMQLAKRRAGTACAKERSAVSGGGVKPYRQKGTGRARQGSIRAANHVGGGKIFGPRPRSYDFSPPKRVRRGAMVSALSLLVSKDKVIILDNFELALIKTKGLSDALERLGARHALLVDAKDNEKLRLSARNLADHRFLPPEGVNVFDILKHDELVMTTRAALAIQERMERPIRGRRASA